jgi:hypothetical protein
VADAAKECLFALQIICLSSVECGCVTQNFESAPSQLRFLLYLIFVEGWVVGQNINNLYKSTKRKKSPKNLEDILNYSLSCSCN